MFLHQNKFFGSLIIGLFVFTFQGFSQSWSLEQCVKHALENNIQLKQQGLNVLYQKNILRQVKTNVFPSIFAGVDHTYNWGRTVDPYTNDFTTSKVRSNNLYFSATLNLFSGFQNYYQIKQNEFNLIASLYDSEKLGNDIALSVSTYFLQVLYDEDLVEATMNQVELSRLQVDRIKKLVDGGTLSKGNLLDIQSQFALEEMQLINTRNLLASAYISLRQLLDLSPDSSFKIERPILPEVSETSISMSVDEIFAIAINLPQIKSAESVLKSAEKSLSVARAARFPKFTLSATYYTGYSDARQSIIIGSQASRQIGVIEGIGTAVMADYPVYTFGNYPFSSQLKDNANKIIAFKITVPIFANGMVQTSVSNSKISVLNNQMKYDLARNNLYKEIQQAHAQALSALAKYNGNKKSLDANEEAFKYTEQKFNLGLLNSVDYLNAKNKLQKSKLDFLQSKYDFIFKKSVLDFYAGKPMIKRD